MNQMSVEIEFWFEIERRNCRSETEIDSPLETEMRSMREREVVAGGRV